MHEIIRNIFYTGFLMAVSAFIIRQISKDDAPELFKFVIVMTFIIGFVLVFVSGIAIIWL